MHRDMFKIQDGVAIVEKLNYLIHERILHIYRSCILSPSVPTDNFDLPMENSFTIGTDRTDGQGFWGLPYALAIMLTTSFTKGFCTFTDRVFVSPSVPTDNFDLPMENWFTIGTDRTDGQGFWGLPYALAIMLTTSFTKGFCTFTDGVFISPSVPADTDGRNNFTKLTVGMLASVLDNPPVLATLPMFFTKFSTCPFASGHNGVTLR